MAEYRALRMVCRHFNLSIEDIDEELEYGKFWCCLAEALDAEELQDYRDAVAMGGKKAAKKWKWATPDHAGTRPVLSGKKAAQASMIDFAAMLSGGKVKKSGDIGEYAKVRQLQRVWQDEEGNLFDQDGNPIESDPGLVFVPLESSDRTH